MKRLYILIYAIFMCLTLQAQSLDSLKIVANEYKAEYGNQDDRYLSALNDVVSIANIQEDYSTAYRYRKEYYEIVKSKFGVNSPEYADACIRMGTVSYRLIGANEGLKYYREGISLYERLGIVNYTYIGGLSLMSGILDRVGEPEDGYKVREKMIRVLEPIENDYVYELISAYIGTYPYLMESGRVEQQILYLEKAQALIKKYHLGGEIPNETSIAFGGPRVCYRNIEQYGKAIESGKESQRYFAEVYGEESIAYAQYSVLIGLDYSSNREYAESRKYLEDGIRRLEYAYQVLGGSAGQDQIYLSALLVLAAIYEYDDDIALSVESRKKADLAFRENGDQTSEEFCYNLYTLYINHTIIGQYLPMTLYCNELEPLIIQHYGKESEEYFRFLTGTFDAFINTFQKERALEFSDKIMSLNNRPKSIGLFTKASVYIQFKEEKKAIPLLEECINGLLASEDKEEKSLIPMCYNSLGNIYLDYDLRLAEEYLNKSIDYVRAYYKNNPEKNLESILNLGMVHYRSGSYNKAISYFEEALTYATDDQNIYQASICLNNIGLCHMMNGDYARAIAILEQARDLSVEHSGENSVAHAMSLQNMTVFYGNLFEYDKCIEMSNKIAAIFENAYGKNNAEYGSVIHNLGIFHMYKEDYIAAADYFRESIRIHESLPSDNRKFLSMSYASLAQALYHEGDIEEGEQAFAQSAALLDDLGLSESFDSVQLLDMYGYSLLEHLDPRAEEFFLRSINTADKIGLEYHPVTFHAKIYYGMSSLLNDGPFDDYIKIMVDALREQYRNNFGLYNESERLQFWTRYSLLHDILFSCRRGDKSNGSLYDYLIITKGMLLNTSTSMSELINKSNDPDLIADYAHLQSIRSKIATLEQKPSSERVESVDSLMNLAVKVERKLITSSKEYGEYTSSSTISWKDISSALQKNEVAVEFVDFMDYKANKEIYAALILRKGWKHPEFITLADAEVLNKIISSENKLSYDVRINNIYSESAAYDNIWGPIEHFLKEGDNVYFSASGILHNLSIEHLADKNEVYACDKYNLHRVSSTRDLAVLKERSSYAYGSATLFGGILYDLDIDEMTRESEKYSINTTRSIELEATDTFRSDLVYLRGSDVEVSSVSSLLKKWNVDCTILKGKEANEESFKHLDQTQNDIIHIATHGFYLPTEKVDASEFLKMMPVFLPGADGQIQMNPIKTSMLRSGLVFAGGNKAWKGEKVSPNIEDGIATSAEIANLNLSNTDLVVLSACETGLGEVNDEGVFGLQRAFKNAGVNTIVMSLWKVSDHITQQMMTRFYSNLLEGQSKHEAFSKAQQEIRQEYPNPYQWAAFIMLD